MVQERKIRVCEICKKQFFNKRKTVTCGVPECRKAAHKMRHNDDRVWKPEEIDLVDRMLGLYPIDQIMSALHKLERENGWQLRSHFSTRQMVRRKLQDSVVNQLDNITMQQLADDLQLSKYRIQFCIRYKGLPSRRRKALTGDGKNPPIRYAISIKAFKKWLKEGSNYALLAGCNEENLALLIGDPELARKAARSPRPPGGNKRPGDPFYVPPEIRKKRANRRTNVRKSA